MSGVRSFDESIAVDPDPLDGRESQFDLHAVEVGLGEAVEVFEAPIIERAAYAFGSVGAWVVQPLRGGRRDLEKAVGRRFIAALWTINPNHFDGRSLSEIAEQLGLNKVAMSLHAADFRRHFKIRNRAQSHAANFRPEAKEPNEH